MELDASLLPKEVWKRQAWDGVFDSLDDSYQLSILTRDQTLVGFALYHTQAGNSQWHLLKFGINKTSQKQGNASILWEIQRQANPKSEIFLEVRVTNIAAISFYIKKEMMVAGLAKGQYSNGEAALRMIGPRSLDFLSGT
jgi:ribosomal protein S18 acetylase RimI-like enzyme